MTEPPPSVSSSRPPSDEGRLSVSRRLLLSSPPGQFDLILADLRTIVHSSSSTTKHSEPSSLLNDEWVREVRNEYESATRRGILVDECAGIEDRASDGGGTDADVVRALRKAVGYYASDCYGGKGQPGQNGTAKESGRRRWNFAVKWASEGGGDGSDGDEKRRCVEVTTYAERVDLRNCHAGSWSSSYLVRVPSPGKSEGLIMEGTVDLVAHAFENGNVQLRSSVPLGPSAVKVEVRSGAGSSAESALPEDTAQAVLDQIRKWEDEEVSSKLGKMYDSVDSRMLKTLRRVMPVTRTKMDWRNLGGQHRLMEEAVSARRSTES